MYEAVQVAACPPLYMHLLLTLQNKVSKALSIYYPSHSVYLSYQHKHLSRCSTVLQVSSPSLFTPPTHNTAQARRADASSDQNTAWSPVSSIYPQMLTCFCIMLAHCLLCCPPFIWTALDAFMYLNYSCCVP